MGLETFDGTDDGDMRDLWKWQIGGGWDGRSRGEITFPRSSLVGFFPIRFVKQAVQLEDANGADGQDEEVPYQAGRA